MTARFALPPALSAKAAPALIADDELRFAALAAELERATAEVRARLEATRRLPGVHSQAALDRDQEVHRLTARLRSLERSGVDLCLGRTVTAGPAEEAVTTLVGRFGVTGGDGGRLVVDWRSPAAEPFFAATHARPSGLASRRRYRWSRVGAGEVPTGPPSPRITDYWDEVFTAEGLDDDVERAALDDQSAFIASLGASRSPRMRDVLGTIQADQDAIIRAGSAGALVVDGGPGTGKTVVGVTDVRLASLSVNYRTPAEVMAEAEPVIRAVLPDANVPTSIRSSGLPVVHGSAAELEAVVGRWLAEHGEGTVCVIAEELLGGAAAPDLPDVPRVRRLTPGLAKGLEFDLVVLLDPDGWPAVDRYVAMTRATQQLVVLTTP